MEAFDFLQPNNFDQAMIDEPELFQFFNNDRDIKAKTLKKVKEEFSKLTYIKDNSKSNLLREDGNIIYKQENFKKSVATFTECLRYATFGCKEYGLSLANRSAVFFMLKDFTNCLKDIDAALVCLISDSVKFKLYNRKCESLHHLCQKSELHSVLNEITEFLVSTDLDNKEEKKQHLWQLFESSTEESFEVMQSEDDKYLASLQFEPNPIFLHASSAVSLRWDQQRGRCVFANRPIKHGEVLFIEKATAMAPVYQDNETILTYKCFHCLRDSERPIPCKECITSMYCGEKCRDLSWDKYHQFECKGFKIKFWYDIGSGFPGFRAMLKGIKSGFHTQPQSFEEDVLHFGNQEDNYIYLNKLLSRMNSIQCVARVMEIALEILIYLEEETHFFSWLVEQPTCPDLPLHDLRNLVGSRIAKHTAQLLSNASSITHWNANVKNEFNLPDKLTNVASGYFPSVSMMNHSCKANVTLIYVCDTVIVKAAHDIETNQEIFNTYGPDWRLLPRKERREHLLDSYNFHCNCQICSNPLAEFDLIDTFKCKLCDGPIKSNMFNTKGVCQKCYKKYQLKTYNVQNKAAQKAFYQYTITEEIDFLMKATNIWEKILSPYNMDLKECYIYLGSHYIMLGDFLKGLEYFGKGQAIEEIRGNTHGRSTALCKYETVLQTIHEIKKQNLIGPILQVILQKLRIMMDDVVSTLALHYENYRIGFNDTFEFISKAETT